MYMRSHVAKHILLVLLIGRPGRRKIRPAEPRLAAGFWRLAAAGGLIDF
jgi:hypothetical protein